MIVVNDGTPGPGVRAIVIGIGHYPNAGAYGLGNLTSAVVSALEFARWLLTEFEHPEGRPLKYLDLLVSPPPGMEPAVLDPRRDAIREHRADWDFQMCDMAAVRAALFNWANACNGSSKDIAFFYFCGHGVEQGGIRALLTGDFDAATDNFAFQSLDLGNLHASTALFEAEDIYFFVDACRSTPGRLGTTPIYPATVLKIDPFREHLGEAPLFLATRGGENAWGQPNEPSQFTDALLRALRGSGVRRGRAAHYKHWIATAFSLSEGMESILKIKVKLKQAKRQDPVLFSATSAQKPIHRLKPNVRPKVPIYLHWTGPPIAVTLTAVGNDPFHAPAAPLQTFECWLNTPPCLATATIHATAADGSAVTVEPPEVPLDPPALEYDLSIL